MLREASAGRKHRMTRSRTFLDEFARLLLGVVALAVVTGLFFWLDLPLVSAAFAYLIVIVSASLVTSFPYVAVLCLVAIFCLNFFFAKPALNFQVELPQDIAAAIAFLLTSLIVSGLVRRLRSEESKRLRVSETLRETQAQLAHLNRIATLNQLVTSIAHEVKQPIAATITHAQAALHWLDRSEPNAQEVRRALDNIINAGNHAAGVIDRVRAPIGKTSPRKDRVDLNRAILEVIQLAQGEAAKNGVSVRTNLAAGLPLIEGDRVQLQQVILNLVVNAVEAMNGMADGPRDLLIKSGREAGHVFTEVQDSGPGLDPAAHKRLFQPFYTTKTSGLGMGLSICRSIIEAHGGSLVAEANAPRGAIFRFTVPCSK